MARFQLIETVDSIYNRYRITPAFSISLKSSPDLALLCRVHRRPERAREVPRKVRRVREGPADPKPPRRVRPQLDPLLQGVSFFVFDDQAEQITSALNGLTRAGLVGALMALVVLYVFLRRLRATLIVSLSIPFPPRS